MKNKKSLIAIIVLFLVIGVTIAYFTSSASFENIFNTGTYKVVTAYKNYSDIDSSGVTRTISASQTDTSTYSATTDVTSGSTYSMSNHCFTSNPTSCIHLIKDGATVSSGYSVSVSYYESDGSKYSTLSEDNIDEAGTKFSTIVYDVKYNGASRAKVTVSNVTITR